MCIASIKTSKQIETSNPNPLLKTHALCLLGNILISIWESSHVGLDWALVSQELDVSTIDLDTSLLSETDVLLSSKRGEAPVLGDDDLLATRELVHGTAEGLDGGGAVSITGADGKENLADVDTGDGAVGFTEGTTHTGLQSIGTSARQHLVDTDDMEWMGTDTQVETFLSGNLDKVPDCFPSY